MHFSSWLHLPGFSDAKHLRAPSDGIRWAGGVRLIDPTSEVCLEKTCPAVIGDMFVYRNGAHLTATYVRTLSPWLAKRLPEPVDEPGNTP